MTRKDVKKAIEIVRATPKHKERVLLTRAFMRLLHNDRPQYNLNKFVRACNGGGH